MDCANGLLALPGTVMRRGIACAALLAALACGGDEEPSAALPETAAERPAPATSGGLEFPSDRGLKQPPFEETESLDPDGSVDDRVGDVLDMEPEGAGLDALIRSALEDPSPEVREAAVVSLGDSEEVRALDALISASEDSDPNVVLAAIDQLGWSDDRRAEDALRRLAESSNPEIAEAAQEELEDE